MRRDFFVYIWIIFYKIELNMFIRNHDIEFACSFEMFRNYRHSDGLVINSIFRFRFLFFYISVIYLFVSRQNKLFSDSELNKRLEVK